MDPNKTASLERLIREEHGNIAGLVVLQNGEKRYEQFFNGCTAQSRVHVYSVTKSVVSILTGIALDRGDLAGVRQLVLDFFPGTPVKRNQSALPELTLEHLLTMTVPYRYGLFPPYVPYFTSSDWAAFALGQVGRKERLGKFQYAPLIGPDLLSAILMKATGRTVLGFAAEHLFGPLGITVARSIVFQTKEEQLAFNQATDVSGWAADAKGLNPAGWGLTLSAGDMARLGQLYLSGGVWQGRQIVSSEWVAESTREHARWQRQNLPYGYLWWGDTAGTGCYAAMGDGGNVIYVDPQRRLVVAIAALFAPRVKDRLALIRDHIVPLFAAD